MDKRNQAEEFHRTVAELNGHLTLLADTTDWRYRICLCYYRIYYKVLFNFAHPFQSYVRQWVGWRCQ